MYTNSLSHHGILGMKWGIRRYQNADGSLTDAGKQRYKKMLKADVDLANQWNQSNFIFGKTDKIKARNSNYLNVMREVEKQASTSSKESLKMKKAYEEMDAFNDRYKGKKITDDIRDEAMKLWDEYQNARGEYIKKNEKLIDQYAGDILGARLKDLGHEDTELGREMLGQIMGHRKWNPYWYVVDNVYNGDLYDYDYYSHYEDNWLRYN